MNFKKIFKPEAIKLTNIYLSFALLITLAFSCTSDFSKHANISLHSTGERNSFIFTVSEEFLEKNKKSLKYDSNSSKVKISEIEFKLLIKLLKQKKFCINKNGKVEFELLSRQEKIYDMTFSHLIATSYKAKPLTPLSYFGECKN